MRRKVVAVLAIPVIVSAAFGGLRVSSELQDATAYSSNQQHATVVGPVIAYIAASERLALPPSLSNRMGTGNETAAQAYAAAEATLKRAQNAAGLNSNQSGLISSMIVIGDQLRSGSGTGITASAAVQVSDMARYASQILNSTLDTSGTPDPRVQALNQAFTGRVSLVKQQLLIESAKHDTNVSLLGSVWLAAEIGVEGAALNNLRGIVGGRRVSSLYTANGTRLGQATSDKTDHLSASPRLFATYDLVDENLLTNVTDQLAAQASQAKSRVLIDTGIILGALLASLLLALLVARALINPLRKVRAGALEVAHVKLPETIKRIRNGQEPDELTIIDVHTSEELGQLARAVDDMHRQAVSLATGEAQLRSQVGAMFVTLSRRNTTLVNQQLALIESLEQDEEDPQRLEQLFSLDHLATRMRRTAESLVILGGTTGRTASFEELSVSDVVHAAVSEVQDYQRVRIDAAPDRLIVGRVASDVVHLMAELIDNALSYSPPGTPVNIQAADEGDRVEIEIVDSGLGMAGEALAQANAALKNGGEVTVDTARRMGLFVVSRLAEEHGLKVKLRRNTNGGGIIAAIVLPADALVSSGPVAHVSALDAPDRVDEPVVAVEPEEEEEYDPYLERIEEAIAAVTGLPRRRPGSVVGSPEPVPTPAAAVSMFEVAPEIVGLPEPAALSSADGVAGDEQDDGLVASLDEPAAVWDEFAAADESEDLAEVMTPDFGFAPTEADLDEQADADAEAAEDDAAEELPEHEVAQDTADQVVAEAETAEAEADGTNDSEDEQAEETVALDETADETVAPQDVDVDEDEDAAAVALTTVATAPETEAGPEPITIDAPMRLTIRRPLSAAPAASALEGDHVIDDDVAPSTPIFGQLRSNWLNDETDSAWVDPEVDRGWSAADRAEAAPSEEHTRTGLPLRRPGGRLVPGGVSTEPSAVTRDPEAIRNRLAAHAAGVSRGRAAAAAQPITDDYAHEETGPA